MEFWLTSDQLNMNQEPRKQKPPRTGCRFLLPVRSPDRPAKKAQNIFCKNA
jgi:hypothetical protein